MNSLECDTCDGSGQATSGPCGCNGHGLYGMLDTLRIRLLNANNLLKWCFDERLAPNSCEHEEGFYSPNHCLVCAVRQAIGE